MKFDDLLINDKIKKALKNVDYINMTEIQEKVIPLALANKDIIGMSKTGTGKTAAFSIPIINCINEEESKKIEALVLCPTRELTKQVTEELEKIASFMKNVKIASIYGGTPIEKQIITLRRGVNVVVATPGRIIDHIKKKTIKLENIKVVVIDEADEMFKMGFEEDIDIIFKNLPKDRQTMLFSATIDDDVKNISKKYMKKYEDIVFSENSLTADKVKQYVSEVKTKMKNEATLRFLEVYTPNKAVVFCNTKLEVSELYSELKKKLNNCYMLSSDVRQEQREYIIDKFKKENGSIIVSTDVAARGLDIDSLDLVINYSIPKQFESYVHRIGRTARNGNEGKAILLVTGKEKEKVKSLCEFTKSEIEYIEVPSLKEYRETKSKEFVDKITNIVSAQNYANLSLFEKICSENNHNYKEISKALYTALCENNEFIKYVKPEVDKSEYIKLFFSVGKNDNIKAKDIVGAIANNTALSGNKIGKIEVFDKFSFVEIPSEFLDEVIFALNGAKIKGIRVSIEIANKK